MNLHFLFNNESSTDRQLNIVIHSTTTSCDHWMRTRQVCHNDGACVVRNGTDACISIHFHHSTHPRRHGVRACTTFRFSYSSQIKAISVSCERLRRLVMDWRKSFVDVSTFGRLDSTGLEVITAGDVSRVTDIAYTDRQQSDILVNSSGHSTAAGVANTGRVSRMHSFDAQVSTICRTSQQSASQRQHNHVICTPNCRVNPLTPTVAIHVQL